MKGCERGALVPLNRMLDFAAYTTWITNNKA